MRKHMGELGLVAIAFLLAAGAGCSRDGSPTTSEPRLSTASDVKLAKNGPTESDIAGALQSELAERAPGVTVKSLVIEGQESLGNQVDPVFGQRFHAAAVLSEDLLSKSFLLDGRLFATVAVDKGMSVDMYGKIMSRRYQDSWKHDVSFEGNPFAALNGKTRQVLEKDGQATVIQIGTDEEARLLEQWRSEGKITARPDVESVLVGTWDGECTKEGSQKPDWVVFTSIEPGGIYREGFVRLGGLGAKYEMEPARKRKYTGTWSVYGGGILDRHSNYNGGNRNVERIVSIDPTSYVSEAGGLRCVWTRVDLATQEREAQLELERQKSERIEAEQERVERSKRNESLLKAASKGDARLTQELVAEGVDLATQDYNGRTALMLAARYGHTEVMKALLAAGADPNVKNRWGSTALSWARREKQTEAERILIEAGAKE